eukprot:TRINITY_DN4919_c0_g1_i1.p1 TRINITY_DN4919_c0_g1~~TRINITY_DN4919_c0_g1_i1.p1  ORF type:complete len:447 (-),score=35.29 TRINITY_DN4919_c0_g1_i1:81-1421(-)
MGNGCGIDEYVNMFCDCLEISPNLRIISRQYFDLLTNIDSLGHRFKRIYDCIKPITSFDQFMSLPTDIQTVVFQLLPDSEKAGASSVCHAWESILRGTYLLCLKIDKTSHEIDSLVDEMLKTIESMNNITRLSYLSETLNIIHGQTEHIKIVARKMESGQSNTGMLRSFLSLILVLRNEMRETRNSLLGIKHNQNPITSNFDIYDHTLRKFSFQINKMFIDPSLKGPIDSLFHPELIIQDTDARNAWIKVCGNSAYFTNLKTLQRLVEQLYIDTIGAVDVSSKNYKDISAVIEFFTHFPANQKITVYSWYLLLCHWGPYKNIISNLNSYALKNGFLGLINSVTAQELLEKETGYGGKKYPFLLRFSRGEPETLTMTYKYATKRANGTTALITSHIRKSSNKPIDKFIATVDAKVYYIIPKHMDWARLKQNKSTSEYSSHADHYITI